MKKNNLITEEIYRIKEIMGLSQISEQATPLISGAEYAFTDDLAKKISGEIAAYIPELIKKGVSKEFAGLSKNTALNLLRDISGANGVNPNTYRNKKSILSKSPIITKNQINLNNIDTNKLIEGFKDLPQDTQINIIKKYIDSMVQIGIISPGTVASEMKAANDLDYQWALWWASNGTILPKKGGQSIRPKDPQKYLDMDFDKFMDLQGVPASVQKSLYDELAPALATTNTLNPKYGGSNEPLINKSTKAALKPNLTQDEVAEALFSNLGNFTNNEINPKRIYNGLITSNEPELVEVKEWLLDPKHKNEFVTYLQSKSDIGKQAEEFFNYLQREGVFEPEKINLLRRIAMKCRAKYTLPEGTKFGLFGGLKEVGKGDLKTFEGKVWFCKWIQSWFIYNIVITFFGTKVGWDVLTAALLIQRVSRAISTGFDYFKGCTKPEDQDRFLKKDSEILSLMPDFPTGQANKERTIDLIVKNNLYYKGNYQKFQCNQPQLFVIIPKTELDGVTIDHSQPGDKYVLELDWTGDFILSPVDEATAKDTIWSTLDKTMIDLEKKAKEGKEKAKEKLGGGTPTAEPATSEPTTSEPLPSSDDKKISFP